MEKRTSPEDPKISDTENYLISQYEKDQRCSEILYDQLYAENSTKLSGLFKEAAGNVSNLYLVMEGKKPRNEQNYQLFRKCTTSITQLYTENSDRLKKMYDLGYMRGKNKTKRDIHQWAKKKKKYVKREEVFRYLARNGNIVYDKKRDEYRDISQVNSDGNLKFYGRGEIGRNVKDDNHVDDIQKAMSLVSVNIKCDKNARKRRFSSNSNSPQHTKRNRRDV